MTEMLKDDKEKLRWDLLPFEPIEWIVKVLTFGAKKYEPNNWKKGNSQEDIERTFAAAMRHISKYRQGEYWDVSGLPHLAHILCDFMFLIYHEEKKTRERDCKSNE